MDRPDTETQRNMIVKMAAAIMAAKAKYMRMIGDQQRAKGNHALADKLHADAAKIEQSVAVMDKFVGCWS